MLVLSKLLIKAYIMNTQIFIKWGITSKVTEGEIRPLPLFWINSISRKKCVKQEENLSITIWLYLQNKNIKNALQ